MDEIERANLLVYLARRSRVDASTGCHEWLLSLTSGGKGQMWWNETTNLVHRKKWEALHGPIPPRHYVVQTCGNGRCHADHHLKLVTARELRTGARRRRVAAGR